MTIYNKAKLVVGAVDISTDLRSLAYNEAVEEVDDTAMGDNTRSSAGGLIRWTIEGEANQEYGAGSLDAAFATKVGTVVAVVWRHTTTATAASAAIPKYTGNGLITEYVPMGGSVGDQKIATFSIVSAGDRTRLIT